MWKTDKQGVEVPNSKKTFGKGGKLPLPEITPPSPTGPRFWSIKYNLLNAENNKIGDIHTEITLNTEPEKLKGKPKTIVEVYTDSGGNDEAKVQMDIEYNADDGTLKKVTKIYWKVEGGIFKRISHDVVWFNYVIDQGGKRNGLDSLTIDTYADGRQTGKTVYKYTYINGKITGGTVDTHEYNEKGKPTGKVTSKDLKIDAERSFDPIFQTTFVDASGKTIQIDEDYTYNVTYSETGPLVNGTIVISDLNDEQAPPLPSLSIVQVSVSNKEGITTEMYTTYDDHVDFASSLADGDNTISIMVIDEASNVMVNSVNITVPTYGPTANFTESTHTPKVGEQVEFDATSSQPGWNLTDIPITEYRWDFGDSNEATMTTPITYHAYTEVGIYYVTLTVYAPGTTPDSNMSPAQRKVVYTIPVGGYSVLISKVTRATPPTAYLDLAAISLASMTIVATVATAIHVKRVKRRKDNQ